MKSVSLGDNPSAGEDVLKNGGKGGHLVDGNVCPSWASPTQITQKQSTIPHQVFRLLEFSRNWNLMTGSPLVCVCVFVYVCTSGVKRLSCMTGLQKTVTPNLPWNRWGYGKVSVWWQTLAGPLVMLLMDHHAQLDANAASKRQERTHSCTQIQSLTCRRIKDVFGRDIRHTNWQEIQNWCM